MIRKTALCLAAAFAFITPAFAEPKHPHDHAGHKHSSHGALPDQPQGRHGVGHKDWHGPFYSKLMRKDTKTSCCNLTDCVPTTSRTENGIYEVMVEGEWTPVPKDTIQNVTAPDGGAHVCFPKQPHRDYPKGTLFCVVLPPET